MELNPDLHTIRNNRAMAFLKLGKWTEAEDDCNVILSANSANVKALFRRGLARTELKKLESANADFAAVLHFEPNNGEAIAQIERISSYNARAKRQLLISRLTNQVASSSIALVVQEVESLPTRMRHDDIGMNQQGLVLKKIDSPSFCASDLKHGVTSDLSLEAIMKCILNQSPERYPILFCQTPSNIRFIFRNGALEGYMLIAFLEAIQAMGVHESASDFESRAYSLMDSLCECPRFFIARSYCKESLLHTVFQRFPKTSRRHALERRWHFSHET